MVKRRKDGGYDLRTKEGRERQSWDEARGIYAGCLGNLFKLIFAIIALPFRLIGRLLGF